MESGFQVGDTISLYSHDDLSDTLSRTQYTIVGLVNTPYYLSFQKGTSDIGGGTLNTYIYVDESNFCMDVYTEVFMTFKGLDQDNSYTQEYFDHLDPITNRLKALGMVRSEIRTNEILDEAYAQLDDAKQQYQDGVNEFNEKIADAVKKLGKDFVIGYADGYGDAQLIADTAAYFIGDACAVFKRDALLRQINPRFIQPECLYAA